MARKVIKAFHDKTRGGRLYAPTSRRYNLYEGEREEELFGLGYLGDEIVEEDTPNEENTEDTNQVEDETVNDDAGQDEEAENAEVDLKELSNDELKTLLTEKGIEFPKRITKDELIELLTQE